ADVAALDDPAVALAGVAVAVDAEDVEALLAALEHLPRDGEGELGGQRGLDADAREQPGHAAELEAGAGAAGVQQGVVAELAAGDGVGYRVAGRPAVAEEVAGREGVVAGLVGHLLVAAARQRQKERRREGARPGPARLPLAARSVVALQH